MDRRAGERPSVALTHWGSVIEDFLDPIGVDFETFRTEMTGGWMFGFLVALREAGLDPVLVCISRGTRSAYTTLHTPTGIPIEVLPPTVVFRAVRRLTHRLRRRSRVAESVTEYVATPPVSLARVLGRRSCDVVLCQEYESPRFDVLVLLTRLTRRRVFATYQGGNATRRGAWGDHVERRVRRWTMRHGAGFVIASGAELERVRSTYGVAVERLAHVPNPVPDQPRVDRGEARGRLGLPDDAAVVAWHGRVEIQRKGLDVLLDAWQQLRHACPARDLRLLLLGSGSDAEALRRRLSVIGTDDVLWIDEYVHDRARIRDVLAAADVYAFASPHEGFAVAPAEAMAMGVPVVATAAPGIRDLLPDGEISGGIVVPIGDGDALARELRRLLEVPGAAQALGDAARRHVEDALSTRAVGAALRRFLFDDVVALHA